MANKYNYSISDFNERVGILRRIITKDDALNRIETWKKSFDVWAHVEIKNAASINIDNGQIGVLNYTVVLRYNERLLDAIDALEFKGKRLILTVPMYSIDNKYIVIQAREIPKHTQRPCEFSTLP